MSRRMVIPSVLLRNDANSFNVQNIKIFIVRLKPFIPLDFYGELFHVSGKYLFSRLITGDVL